MPRFAYSNMSAGRFEPRLELAYQFDLAQEKRRVYYGSYFLCALIFLLFSVLDVWALPDAYMQAWAIRAAVLALAGIPCLLARFLPDTFVRFYTPLMCASFLVCGAGIEAIILLADSTDAAWSTYYAGLILLSMALYSWTYLLPRYAAAIGLTLALGYIVPAVAREAIDSDALPGLLISCTYLLSANVVGMFALYTRERFSRHNFLLRMQLRDDLEIQEQAKLHSEHRSEHDALTGLPNRVRFTRQLTQLLAETEPPAAVAVLFLDLDQFKPVNDRYGHAVGDHVLRVIAQRLLGTIRATDLVARISGDEFMVAMPLPAWCAATVDRVIGELHDSIGQPIEHQGRILQVSCSIGSACYPDDGSTVDSLMVAADLSMYDFKRSRQAGAAAA